MEEKKEILEIISEDLEKVISQYEDSQRWNIRAFSLIKIDPIAYNRAWFSYASNSVILHHFDELRKLVKGGDVKAVQNYLIFVDYQITHATDVMPWAIERNPQSVILDAQTKISIKFDEYSKLFIEENSAQKSNQ